MQHLADSLPTMVKKTSSLMTRKEIHDFIFTFSNEEFGRRSSNKEEKKDECEIFNLFCFDETEKVSHAPLNLESKSDIRNIVKWAVLQPSSGKWKEKQKINHWKLEKFEHLFTAKVDLRVEAMNNFRNEFFVVFPICARFRVSMHVYTNFRWWNMNFLH